MLANSILSHVEGYSFLDGFAESLEAWGQDVKLYRDYVSGRHPVTLTQQQRTTLNLRAGFSADYTDFIVRAMSERLRVSAIKPSDDNEAVELWLSELATENAFDQLQSQLHNAACRDGDAYIIVEWDNERQQIQYYVNFAYDGSVGVLPLVFNRQGQLEVACKVFEDGGERYAYIYYPDRVDTFSLSQFGASLTPIKSLTWAPNILPVVAFSNRRGPFSEWGISELEKVLPLQDALNRTLLDMLMTGATNAFPIGFAKGFDLDLADVQPGVVVNVKGNSDDVANVDMKWLSTAPMTGYSEQVKLILQIMQETSQTPFQNQIGANMSAEAMRQLESGLLSKINAAQVYFGNSWRKATEVANRVAGVYGAIQQSERFYVEWHEAEVRSDTSILEQARQVYEVTKNYQLYLRMISKVLDLDEDAITDLLENQATANSDNQDELDNDES